MTSITGRQAKVVRLHTPAHAPELGSLGNTVTETHKVHGDLTLTVLEYGNILVYSASKKVEVILYAANIIDVVLKPGES